jgi:phosphatidylglycerol:prolipoprotein diacylglycerol transferase
MLRELHLALGDLHVVVSSHGLAVLAGVTAGARLALRRARDPDVVRLALVLAVPAALLGASALYRLVHGMGGGLSSTGGVVGVLVVAWIVARAARCPVATLLDALAPAALLALAVGRLGCFLAGCCYGRPTSLPWGVVFPELGPPARHPLQLYAALGDGALLLLLPRADAPCGTVARAAAIGYGVLRTGLETLRDPAAADVLPGGMLTLAQVGAMLLAGAAVAAGRSRLRLRSSSTMAPPRRSGPWPTRRR